MEWNLNINMFKDNIKAPYGCMELKKYKLSDFIPEFSEFRQSDDLFSIRVWKIFADNHYLTGKNGKTYFEIGLVICPSCKSKSTVKNGNLRKKINLFLRIGEQICIIQKI